MQGDIQVYFYHKSQRVEILFDETSFKRVAFRQKDLILWLTTLKEES